MSTIYFCASETVGIRVTFVGADGQPIPMAGVAMSYRASGMPTSTSIAAGSMIEDGIGACYTDLPLQTSDDWAVRATCATPTASAVEVGFPCCRM